ncbi:MAG: glycosyl hydrolase [Verrucomicrobia bacterium]|nr:glycosyl hydrolase [Verrucomicrobiota bacterium]
MWTARRRRRDVVPGDLLTAQLKVQPGGRVGLANGASYPVLAIANTTIAPEVLQKIVQLVNAGATLWLRTLPRQSPGWKDCSTADQTIARCLKELGANQPAGVHVVGKGRVIVGEMPVKDMLARLGLAPAFAYTPDDGQPCLDYNQRQDGDTEIYFVANWKEAWHRAECAFRVADKQPELWNPLTGEISPCPQYQVGKDTVRVPLQLPPNGSTFVVFRKKAEGHREPLAKNLAPAGAEGVVVATLAESWRIQFNPARVGLVKFETNAPALFLWNESTDARLQAFAGSASYLTTFATPHSALRTPHWSLDLGAVHDLAEVFVNGKSAGVVWTAPFRVDVTRLLQSGTNALEIRVVNTWHNWRLANKYLPVEHAWSARGLKEPRLPAGLLGPVTVRVSE